MKTPITYEKQALKALYNLSQATMRAKSVEDVFESILEKAREKRIELGNWFESPVHPKEESEWGSIGYKKGACPIAEKLALTCVNLPIHNKIRERELNSIFSFITDNKNSIIGTCLKK